MQTRRPLRIGTRARLLWRGLRYRELLPFASVNGWLTVDEAIALYESARSLARPDALAVEIGCWQGKSSICLAKGLAQRPQGRLVCIDPFDASGDDASADDYRDRADALQGPLRSTFEHNLTAAGVRDRVEVRPGLSHEVATDFDEPIDLLFLDGDHAYESILRDYQDWAPKLRPGGLLLMHDVVHEVHDGPRRVVDEVIAREPFWTDQRYVDSMFLARKNA